MNTKGVLITLTILLLTSCYSFAAGPNCSMNKVSGSYGYTTSGFVLAPSGVFVPAAAAGRIDFDAQGNVSGTQLASSPEVPLPRRIRGPTPSTRIVRETSLF